MDMRRIAIEHPDQPEVLRLIDALDAYQRPLYPAESHHGIDLHALSQPNVMFAVARNALDQAVGCGAVVLEEGHGELKRMYVDPAHRGQGTAKALLDFLEGHAREHGCQQLMLETGILQPEALGLYERAGYRRRGPFGGYGPDLLSVFMHKPLAPGRSMNQPHRDA